MELFEQIAIAFILVFACWGLAHFLSDSYGSWKKRKHVKELLDMTEKQKERVDYWIAAYDKADDDEPAGGVQHISASTQGIDIRASFRRMREVNKEEFVRICSELYDAILESINESDGLNPFEEFLDELEL